LGIVIIPTDVFERGRYTTNQIIVVPAALEHGKTPGLPEMIGF
jgi:hypothetical protein